MVVAARRGDADRTFGEVPGQVDPARAERAAGLEGEDGRGDPGVPAQEPLGGGFQERLGLLVAIPEVEDDPLEGSRGVRDEGVAGGLGGAEGVDGERPGGLEVGVEPPDGRQREAERAESLIALLGGDRQGPLRRVELQAERACRVGDQGDAGQQARLER